MRQNPSKDIKTSHGRSALVKRYKLFVIIGAIIIAIVALVGIILILILIQPARSVENFCKVASEQKSALAGNVSDEATLTAYRKLETVAPDSIISDVRSIRKGYESIVANPGSTLGVGFGIIGAENRVSTFLTSN